MKKGRKHILQKSLGISPLLDAPFSFSDHLLNNFNIDFEKFFNHFPARPLFFPHTVSTSCDIEDHEKEICVQVDLRGVTKKDVKLDISENSIEISAKHKDESKQNKKNFLKKERTELSYYRVLPLPVKVLPEKAKAKLSDGILTITIPKVYPKIQKKKSIAIE